MPLTAHVIFELMATSNSKREPEVMSVGTRGEAVKTLWNAVLGPLRVIKVTLPYNDRHRRRQVRREARRLSLNPDLLTSCHHPLVVSLAV